MESILTSIKKLLGIDEEYDAFDNDLIILINAQFSVLNQLGVGPDEGFEITSKDDVWNTYDSDHRLTSLVKNYIFYKVKLAFDPPATSFGIDAFNEMAKEYEWRLNVMVDPKQGENQNG